MPLKNGSLILVVGFGLKTGVSIARFALARGVRVRAVDSKPAEKLADSMRATGNAVELVSGGMPLSALDGVSLVVLSPGVPRNGELLTEADRRGIPVIGDIELAFRYARCRMAGITGTDGKSTTTAMVGSILETASLGRVAGNIGIPVLDVVDGMAPGSILALELSSFMLESIERFKPEVAAILNLAEDHLDRYPDMESYLAAKLRIFSNLDAGCTAVWPTDNPWSGRFAGAIPAGVRRVSFALDDAAADVHLGTTGEGVEILMIAGEPCLPAGDLPVMGRHNLRNAVSAAAIAFALGISRQAIADGLRAFRGLPHRFENAGTAAGVRFINDSKATTISAVATALDSAGAGSCILIGGRDKGLEFSPLREAILRKNLVVFPFGEAREKVRAQLGCERAGDPSLEVVVREAWEYARRNSAAEIILAPGCTSYDEFPNFEIRGEFFKDLVKRLRLEVGDGET